MNLIFFMMLKTSCENHKMLTFSFVGVRIWRSSHLISSYLTGSQFQLTGRRQHYSSLPTPLPLTVDYSGLQRLVISPMVAHWWYRVVLSTWPLGAMEAYCHSTYQDCHSCYNLYNSFILHSTNIYLIISFDRIKTHASLPNLFFSIFLKRTIKILSVRVVCIA